MSGFRGKVISKLELPVSFTRVRIPRKIQWSTSVGLALCHGQMEGSIRPVGNVRRPRCSGRDVHSLL